MPLLPPLRSMLLRLPSIPFASSKSLQCLAGLLAHVANFHRTKLPLLLLLLLPAQTCPLMQQLPVLRSQLAHAANFDSTKLPLLLLLLLLPV